MDPLDNNSKRRTTPSPNFHPMTLAFATAHPVTFLLPLLGLLALGGYTLHAWGLGLLGILVGLVYLTVVVTCVLFALGLFPGTLGQGRGAATGATVLTLATAGTWAASGFATPAFSYLNLAAEAGEGNGMSDALAGAVNGPMVGALLVALTALLLGLLEGGVGNRTTYTLPA